MNIPTQLVIPEAHAQAIQERMLVMKAVEVQLQTLLGEDRRHVDAVLRTGNVDPSKYAQYNLGRDEQGQWILKLTPKPEDVSAQPLNGEVQPQLALPQ